MGPNPSLYSSSFRGLTENYSRKYKPESKRLRSAHGGVGSVTRAPRCRRGHRGESTASPRRAARPLPFRRPRPRLLPRAVSEAGPGSSRRRPGPSCAALRGGTDVSRRRSRARPRIPPGAAGTARGARPPPAPPPPGPRPPPGLLRESLISPGALCVWAARAAWAGRRSGGTRGEAGGERGALPAARFPSFPANPRSEFPW